jgi:hypothetical protein
MKYFTIKYKFQNGSPEDWHQHIATFIAALTSDPVLKDRISYRCMKYKASSEYVHLASATDDEAIRTLQSREFFQRYTEHTKLVAGGSVEVSPLEIIAETGHRA